jgi:cysteine synthase A
MKIILSEPANAQLVGSGTAQKRSADGAPAGSHPSFEPHPIQGWTPDFIPLVLQEAIDKKYYDQVIPISVPRGQVAARRSRRRKASSGGISSGALFAVRRCRLPRKRNPAASFCACCPTRASAT